MGRRKQLTDAQKQSEIQHKNRTARIKSEKRERNRRSTKVMPDLTFNSVTNSFERQSVDYAEAADIIEQKRRRAASAAEAAAQQNEGVYVYEPAYMVDDDSTFKADRDWTDDEDEDFNEQDKKKKLGLMDLVNRVVEDVTKKRKATGRKQSGQYALEQRSNRNAINRIYPRLARALLTNEMPDCLCHTPLTTKIEVVCIDLTTCDIREFYKCGCEHWTARLLFEGFFPTKPNPKVAISLDVLNLFQAISSNGSFSKLGYALGLKEFHRKKVRRETLSRYDEFFRACIPFYLRVQRERDDIRNVALNKWFERRANEKWHAAMAAAGAAPTATMFGPTITSTPEVGVATATPVDMPPPPPPAATRAATGTIAKPPSAVRKPHVIQIGGLVSQCPACFHRPMPDDKSPVIICLDGNMQHSRYKHVAKDNNQSYNNKLFIDVPYERREGVIDTSLPNVAGTICEHNFKATTKPNTMKFKDETGLLMIVCRHDMPLRFMNLYAGERLGWVVEIIAKFMEALDKAIPPSEVPDESAPGKKILKPIPVILLYDIACQLSPYIRKRNEDILKRLSVAVNKFHGYAHEYRCQELFGQHQTKFIGQSDGEGTERVWALLRPLVVPGRISTIANRMLFLENLAFAIMTRKRMALANSLYLRYRRQLSLLRFYEKELDKLCGLEAQDGNGNTMLISEDLLRDEQIKQRAYFTTTSPLITKPYLNIYDALQKEAYHKSLVAEVNEKYENQPKTDAVLANFALDLELAGAQLLPTLKKTAETALAKAGLTRDDWAEDGERWALATRLSNADHKVFEAVLLEESAREKLNEKTAANPRTPDALLSKYRKDLEKAEQHASAAITALGSTREEWDKEGPRYKKQYNFAKLTELQLIYNRLLFAAASRTLELRQVKANTFGGKPAAKLMDGIHKKHAAMSKDIRKFNDILKLLPPSYAPHALTLAAFKGTDDVSPGLKSEKARDALFHLHVLKSDLLGTKARVRSYWSCSESVRVGISHQLRRDRCLEEMALLKTEWRRHVSYTTTVVEGVLDFVIHADSTGYATHKQGMLAFLWDELRAADVIAKVSGLAKKKFGSKVFPIAGLEALIVKIKVHLNNNFRNGDNIRQRQGRPGEAAPRDGPLRGNQANTAPRPPIPDYIPLEEFDQLKQIEEFEAMARVKDEPFAEDELDDMGDQMLPVGDGASDDEDDLKDAGYAAVLTVVSDVAEKQGMVENDEDRNPMDIEALD